MASEVDICNLALSMLGDEATLTSIDPPEGSAQADHCKRFYPMARDAVLELHPWGFCTKRQTLAQLDTTVWNWTYAYRAPSQCLRILAVMPSDATTETEEVAYDTEGGDDSIIIRTNQELAVCRYIERITDTTRYSSLVVHGIATLLASHLAGPVIKGEAGKAESKAQMQAFMSWLAMAKEQDARQRRVIHDHQAPWIANR